MRVVQSICERQLDSLKDSYKGMLALAFGKKAAQRQQCKTRMTDSETMSYPSSHKSVDTLLKALALAKWMFRKV
jgi:hypothetical protein